MAARKQEPSLTKQTITQILARLQRATQSARNAQGNAQAVSAAFASSRGPIQVQTQGIATAISSTIEELQNLDRDLRSLLERTPEETS